MMAKWLMCVVVCVGGWVVLRQKGHDARLRATSVNAFAVCRPARAEVLVRIALHDVQPGPCGG